MRRSERQRSSRASSRRICTSTCSSGLGEPGLGRALVEQLLDDLRARRVAGVHLGVDTDNGNAIGFYRHLGFREVATEPGGILMGLRLE